MIVRLITGAAPRKDDGPRLEWLAVLSPLVLAYLDAQRPDLVLVGDAAGVDAVARDWCNRPGSGAQLQIGKALWIAYERPAGPLRNRAMVQTAAAFAMSTVNDVRAAAFPGPNSRGTWCAVKLCEEFRVPVDLMGPWGKTHAPETP